MQSDNCGVLMTGASAGIGIEIGRELASGVHLLVLVARREQRLNEMRNELMQQHPTLSVHIRKTDLADRAQLKELVAWIERQKINVDLLINNAGLGDSGPFTTTDPNRNDQILLVNISPLTSLPHHLLPL